MINDLNYSIKMISSNKLYEAELEVEDPDEQSNEVSEKSTTD